MIDTRPPPSTPPPLSPFSSIKSLTVRALEQESLGHQTPPPTPATILAWPWQVFVEIPHTPQGELCTPSSRPSPLFTACLCPSRAAAHVWRMGWGWWGGGRRRGLTPPPNHHHRREALTFHWLVTAQSFPSPSPSSKLANRSCVSHDTPPEATRWLTRATASVAFDNC